MKAKNFTLKDQSGENVSLKDFFGKLVVLYFYPKDDTPGCTIEAIDFTILKKDFESLGTVIVGISPDSEKSHCNFIEKHNLGVILLSDPDKKVMKSYQAYGKKILYGKEVEGVIRSTFLINPQGEIVHSWKNIKVEGHVQQVLDKLKELI